MRKRSVFLLILAIAVLLVGCAPKVVGKRKHKRIRDCGCELLREQNAQQDTMTAYLCENEDK